MDSQSNTNLRTTDESFVEGEYSYAEERALNQQASIKLQTLEQQRRLADAEGEDFRRQNAKQVSSIIVAAARGQTSSRWSSFAALVRQVFQNASSDISAATTAAKEGSAKGWSTVRSKVVAATAKVKDADLSEPLINAGSSLGEKVAHKGAELTREASRAGALLESKFENVTHTVSDRSIVVGNTVNNIVKLGDTLLIWAADVVKSIAIRFSGWAYKTWSQAVHNANLQYSNHVEEKERKRRIASDNESTAILNALAVSSLLKQLAPEFYRPTEEPSRNYMFALLEEKEQQHRIAQEKLGHGASNKAHYIADMIKAHGGVFGLHPAKEMIELQPVFTAEQVIEADPMQIFEEPRDIAQELSSVAMESKAKVVESVTGPGTPQSARAAM